MNDPELILAPRMKLDERYYDYDGSVEFETLRAAENCDSPPLWKATENSPSAVCSLMSLHSHDCSKLPAKTRMEAILNGKRELMEMIQKLPESSYELSLTDLIVDQETTLHGNEIAPGKPAVVLHPNDNGGEWQEKKTNIRLRTSSLSRMESFDSNAPLLKMFFPASLLRKKKPVNRKPSEDISWSSSFEGLSLEGFKRNIEKEWWKKLTSKLKTSNGKNTNETRSCSINNHKGRQEDSNAPPGCWSFIQTKKDKTWREGRCLF